MALSDLLSGLGGNLFPVDPSQGVDPQLQQRMQNASMLQMGLGILGSANTLNPLGGLARSVSGASGDYQNAMQNAFRNTIIKRAQDREDTQFANQQAEVQRQQRQEAAVTGTRLLAGLSAAPDKNAYWNLVSKSPDVQALSKLGIQLPAEATTNPDGSTQSPDFSTLQSQLGALNQVSGPGVKLDTIAPGSSMVATDSSGNVKPVFTAPQQEKFSDPVPMTIAGKPTMVSVGDRGTLRPVTGAAPYKEETFADPTPMVLNGQPSMVSVGNHGTLRPVAGAAPYVKPDPSLALFAPQGTAGVPGGGQAGGVPGVQPAGVPAAGPASAAAGNNGDAYLSTLNPSIAAQVKALAEGRMAFPSGFALKSPYWQGMLQAVSQYDPNFDAVNYNARSKTRNDFVAGKDGQITSNLNTAIGHLGTLYDQVGGTASHGGFPLATTVNAVQNAISTSSGDPGVPLFKDTAGKLAQELTAVYRGSGGAESDVVRSLQSLDPNASLATKQAILKNAVDLLNSKIDAQSTKYNRGMGTTEEPIPLLSPHASDVLARVSGAAAPAAGSAATTPTAGWTVRKVSQ